MSLTHEAWHVASSQSGEHDSTLTHADTIHRSSYSYTQRRHAIPAGFVERSLCGSMGNASPADRGGKRQLKNGRGGMRVPVGNSSAHPRPCPHGLPFGPGGSHRINPMSAMESIYMPGRACHGSSGQGEREGVGGGEREREVKRDPVAAQRAPALFTLRLLACRGRGSRSPWDPCPRA